MKGYSDKPGIAYLPEAFQALDVYNMRADAIICLHDGEAEEKELKGLED